jgi:diaminopimelate decarboxylase
MKFWRALLRPLLAKQPTPFYLFSARPLEEALHELEAAFARLPVRHWLSFKTQPFPPLLRWWQRRGGVEVVSRFELQAALAAGFEPAEILVNGPAKHHWLAEEGRPRLKVNFDSVAEARALARIAHRLDWSCGLRLQTNEEFDPEAPEFPTQFGLSPAEAQEARRVLLKAGARLETLHFHLRTNVASPEIYQRALGEAAEFCRATGFAPLYLDCGGGFPAPNVWSRGGQPLDAGFALPAMAKVYTRALKSFPGARELWLENGRWVSARSGVLVVKILDAKDRRGMRSLICDGGRTLHALVATWERHRLFSVPDRRGATQLTTVHGPTCMAFDQLARCELPHALRPGDHLVWMDAGAYHLPWETKFSHGLAAVLWHDGRRVTVARPSQTFKAWFGQL